MLPTPPSPSSHAASRQARLRLAWLSIAVGILVLGLKFLAYLHSGSAALLSDAIESVVNVLGASFALGAVIYAEKPADPDHPYGHGKIEHFSAAFEGGLIALAAILIAWEALTSLYAQLQGQHHLQNLGEGVLINLGAGALNGILGFLLLKMGRKHRSRAIEADGHHVISDFYTTLALAGGLLLVHVTGLQWLDPLLALGVGIHLAMTGFKLMTHSGQALLDAEDPALVRHLVASLNKIRPPELVTVHELKTLRSGRYTHVDIHLVLPEFLSIQKGHALADQISEKLLEHMGNEGEVHAHIDPCQRRWCRICAMEPCPIRQEGQEKHPAISMESATDKGAV